MPKKINLIFLGGFDFPHGMAGTKRIQNAISGLKCYPDISISVVVLSQSSRQNMLNGLYKNISYETVIPDLVGIKMLFMIPVLRIKANGIIKRLYAQDQNNILYVYGPPSFDNIGTINCARNLGYKVVFDIVEDYELAYEISNSILHRLKISYICYKLKNIASIADGIVVISSHLENKFRSITSCKIPIHNLPISVDMDCYPQGPRCFGNPINLFYAGSFGKKDGVPFLLDAFDMLAAKRQDIQLILTGAGTDEVMREVFERIAASPYNTRIDYTGYLDDASYFKALNSADILCMPRIDTGYAQAGFPFKLGEYLSTGKPVIASAVSDIPKLLTDRKEAMLVSPGVIMDIVNAVEYLIDNKKEALEIGVNGRALAKSLFEYRVQNKGLYDYLMQIYEQ